VDGVVHRGQVELTASPKQIWPLLTDTDRLNRVIGMNPVHFAPNTDPRSAARFLARTTMGGLLAVYEEFPFEWTLEKRFGVRRRFRRGPLSRLELDYDLAPGARQGGTHLGIVMKLVPSSVLFWPAAWIGGKQAVAAILALARQIDAHLTTRAPSPYRFPIAPTRRDTLETALGALKKRGVDPALADRLGAHLTEGADADMVRLRPYELAGAWAADRRQVLAMCLHAVQAGLLELRWAIICPSCLTPSQQVPALEDVPLDGHCQLCDIAFELELDRAVEATFVPHPAIRGITDQVFCIGGPARTPHVLAQAIVGADTERILEAPPTPGRYRIFSRGGARASLEVGDDAPSTGGQIEVQPERIEPVELRLRTGAPLKVANATPDERHVKIERLEYASLAATAHEVSTVPEFRTFFSGELLKRSTPLKVARVSILFSDLTGSTALYSKVGDAAAFRLVDDHFDLLRAAIGAHHGTIVKTMGDAVMAAFIEPGEAFAAALEGLSDFERFRRKSPHGQLTHVKLGMYTGACYVVTANGALDYFGQTVNVASRLQHLAGSGEIVLLREEAEQFASAVPVTLGPPERVRVKGVEQELEVVRARSPG
jgi:class 3 adenylate cyclase